MSNEGSISIIRRLVESFKGPLTPAVAEIILQLDFSPSDHARMEELADKSDRGELTAAEGDEYDRYIELVELLAIWQSKARMCLRRNPAQV
jgi:hypothetical protein